MDFTEKTLNSQTVYDGKIIKVLKDDVEISDGHKSFREVVKHSGGVVILAINKGKVLFVKQFRYPMKEVLLELPAGKLEYGEDPFKAAQRELEEETGYCADNWTDLGFVYTSPGYSDEKLYLYKAENLHFTQCHPDEGEILEPIEIKIDDAINMINKGEINDAKTLCAFMRADVIPPHPPKGTFSTRHTGSQASRSSAVPFVSHNRGEG